MMIPREMTDVASEHHAIERLLHGDDVKIRWIEPGKTPHADLKARVIYIPKLTPSFTADDRRLHRAYVWHENGHLDHSQDGLLEAMQAEGITFESYLGKAINGVDDLWQEMVTSKRYVGAADDLDFCQAWHCKKAVDMFEKGMKTDPFITKLIGLMYAARSEWQGRVALHADRYLKHTDISEWEHLIPRLNTIIAHPTPIQETIAIARELFEKDPEAPNPDEAPDPQEGEGENEGKGGECKAGEGEDGQPTGGTFSYRELLMHEHEKNEEDGVLSGVPMTIEYDHDPADDYDPVRLEDIQLGYPEPRHGHLRSLLERDYAKVREETAHVSGAVKRLFQSESQTKRLYLQKRGKIATKNLSRLPAGEDRIFSKKTNAVRGDADVYLLVDASGSMASREKYARAGCAAASLAEALSAANIPCKVAAFTTDREQVCHHTIKDWKEPGLYDTMSEHFLNMSLDENGDGENLMQCYRELQQRNANRKVLIVLSDGQPSWCERDGDLYTYTANVIKMIESKMEVYGIGIQSNAVAELYKHHVELESVEDIEPAIIEVVSKYILQK
jgi:hypothetical protein